MYSDMWDTTGPIPALLYSGLHALFGQSALAHELLALFILFIQCAVFNAMLLGRKAYNENTYVPALLYGLLGSWYLELFNLTPLLIGLTFVLLGYQQLFSHLQSRAKEDEAILLMGLMMGLAALCHLPLGLLMVPLFLALGFFSSTVPRRYALIVVGFFLPMFLSGVFYFLFDGLGNFINFFLLQPFTLAKAPIADWGLMLSLLAVPTLLMLPAIARTLTYPRFINFQSRLQQIMLLWLVVGLLLWLRAYHRNTSHLLLLVPPMAFFLSHYLLLFKKARWAEVTFWIIWVPVAALSLNPVTGWLPFLPGPESVLVPETQLPATYHDKSMWVLGDYPEYYQHASNLGTAFYHWDLAEKLVDDIDRYGEIEALDRAVDKPLPEVVVDPDDRFAKLLPYYPEWQAAYRHIPQDSVWVRRP